MKKIKLHLTLDEWNTLKHSVNDLKTIMTEKGFFTNEVDDLLLKIMTAKTKRIKIA